jgi:ABC-type antimicrobial peptide transport system permease subunit
VILEGRSGMDALRRSRALMKGNIGTAFVLGFLLSVIGFCLGTVAGLLPGLIGAVAAAIIQTICFILGVAALVVFYFTSRCKLENFDLTILARTVSRDVLEPSARPQGE